ncbi:MAG TPA: GMC family oxidoreductase [Chitinophagaceae bacterium]|nr:GMC family oxidoreductase [Chitinophagaceae bacterium]
MLIDLRTYNSAEPLQADVCIIGSGAAGIAAAREFLNTPVKVLLVESGNEKFNQQIQDLYKVQFEDCVYNGALYGRIRTLGGSTTRWGGQALPLTEHDFEKREWVRHSGWPISYQEVNRFIPRALRLLQVDQLNFTTDIFPLLKLQPPPFDNEVLDYHVSKWSPAPDFKKNYIAQLKNSSNITVVTNANVTRIDLSDARNQVERIELTTLENITATVRAKHFLLCTGGIENARILLSNTHQVSAGIGNSNDLVGRFLQDHPAAMIGILGNCSRSLVQKLFNIHYRKGLKYSVRFSLNRKSQERFKTMNATGGLFFRYQSDHAIQILSNAKWAIRSRSFSGKRVGELMKLSYRFPDLLVPAYYYLFHNRSVKPRTVFDINIMTEQEPNPESRVYLGRDKDRLGIPMPVIRWKLTDLSWHTAVTFARLTKEQFQQAGLGEIQLYDWLQSKEDGWERRLTDLNHHIGTTRMSESPSDGVVDTNCRVHGLHNLWIAGSSVFPTSGHSNPTLTLLALTYRTVDTIKAILHEKN